MSEFLIINGGNANNKQLSEQVYNSNNTLQLLVGYLEGDGHQKKNANYDGNKRETIECSTIYEKLAKQIRQLLIDNGIWCSIRFIPMRRYMRNPQFSISISRGYINKIAEHSLKFYTVDQINIHKSNVQYETDEGFWTPIRMIDDIEYDDFVYNFEVEDDNSYVASNVAVHNCMAFMMVMFQLEEEEESKVYGQSRVTIVARQLEELELFQRA